MLERIENDLFNIAERIKSINPKYVLFRNTRMNRVEVHTSPCPCALSFEFVVPYDELDERTLEHARKTRIENFDALEHEQTKANTQIQASAKRNAEQSCRALADMMKYADNQIHQVVFRKNNKWF